MGFTRMQLAFFATRSPEYLNRQVQLVYQSLLHRAPDPGGQMASFGYLATGHSVEQLKAIVMGSTEYFQKNGQGTNAGFLNAVAHDVLGRAIDPAGMTVETQLLSQGVSRAEIAAGSLGSPEGAKVFGQNAYQQFLQRPADSAGLAAVVGYLGTGKADDSLITAILVGSNEFFNLG
jgi:hypothetical protein